jgi:hypothetical protein
MRHAPHRPRRREHLLRWTWRAFASAAVIACLSAGSCDKTQGPDSMPDPDPDPDPDPVQVADFSRHDVNSTSPTFDTDVSPRDHLGSVSAWYFGHAT